MLLALALTTAACSLTLLTLWWTERPHVVRIRTNLGWDEPAQERTRDATTSR